MSTKPTEIAAALRTTFNPFDPEPVNHEAAEALRRIQARDAGIIGDRAALQRSLEGADKPETAHERKQRLIARGTARLISMGYSRKEAKRIARQSYNLARKDTAA